VLSSAALTDPAWCRRAIDAHGDRIVVGVDVRVTVQPNGTARHRLTARGAIGDLGDLDPVLERLGGGARCVVTDVDRDGTLAGPNLDLCVAVAGITGGPVVVSGGIASLDDLVRLADVAAVTRIEGAIVGRALSDGRFTLPEALAAVDRNG
jgi:phosphoribosylanthranilate isomerase